MAFVTGKNATWCLHQAPQENQNIGSGARTYYLWETVTFLDMVLDASQDGVSDHEEQVCIMCQVCETLQVTKSGEYSGSVLKWMWHIWDWT